MHTHYVGLVAQKCRKCFIINFTKPDEAYVETPVFVYLCFEVELSPVFRDKRHFSLENDGMIERLCGYRLL